MNPMTALAFNLSGAALRMSMMPLADRRSRLFVQAFAFILVLLGALRLSEYLFGWNLGISLLLFKDKVTAVSSPSFMAPTTALNFLLLGLGLILQDAEAGRGRRLSEPFILLPAFIALIGIIGFTHSSEYLYSFSMAIHTASTFILLCLGLLSLRPDYKSVRMLLSPYWGGFMARRLVPAALVIPLLLDWMRMKGQQAGWYGGGTGAAAFTASLIAIVLGFIWWISATLDRIDAERRSNEERARENRKELSKQTRILTSVLSSMAEGVIVAGLDGKFLVWNAGAEGIINMGSADIPQDEWSDRYGLYRPDQTTLYTGDQLPLSRAIHGESIDAEEMFLRNAKTPKGVWLNVSGRPLRDESGTLLGGLIVFTDITKRKLVEHRFQRVLESAPDGIVIVDAGGRIMMINRADRTDVRLYAAGVARSDDSDSVA